MRNIAVHLVHWKNLLIGFFKEIKDYKALVINTKTASNGKETFKTIKAPYPIPEFFLKF